MKKSALACIVLSFFSCALAAGPVPLLKWAGPPGSAPDTYEQWLSQHPYTDYHYQTCLPKRKAGCKAPAVAIITEESIYAYLTEEIDTLAGRLEEEGYAVLAYSMGGGIPDSLRAFLKGLYDTCGLEGALLIGDLPVAWFEVSNDFNIYGYAQWPMDLYYMDLNGTWLDTLGGANGVYDGHADSIEAEIYIGRLMPTGMTNGIGLLKNYFSKDFGFRDETLFQPPKALVFVDDDWVDWASEWTANVALTYKDCLNCCHPDTTRAYIYSNKLVDPRAWVSVFAHSWPLGHSFKWSGGSEYYYAQAYVDENPPANFYNHFACSFARYTSANYGGGMSIFNPSYGLGAIGSTKTGSMLEFHSFYGPLGQGKSLGQAFKDWFNYILLGGVSFDDLCWFYGMTLLGDPFLKPAGIGCYLTLTKPAGGETFDENDTIKVTWKRFGFDPVAGYRLVYSLDGGTTFNDTIPSAISGLATQFSWLPPAVNSAQVKLKLMAADSFNNVIGQAEGPGCFTIDTAPPDAAVLVSPIGGQTVATETVCFTWRTAFDLCGVSYYQVQCAPEESFSLIEMDTTVAETTLVGPIFEQTEKWWQVRAVDFAGHISEWSPVAQFVVSLTGVETPAGEKPAPEFFRTGSFPNPARQAAEIRYQLPQTAEVRINIYNISGQLVQKFDLGQKGPGSHLLKWNTGSAHPGIYFYRLMAGEFRGLGKITVVK
jgi:hypothetical protein